MHVNVFARMKPERQRKRISVRKGTVGGLKWQISRYF